MVCYYPYIHSLKKNSTRQEAIPKGNFIFQPSISRCYVSFREGNSVHILGFVVCDTPCFQGLWLLVSGMIFHCRKKHKIQSYPSCTVHPRKLTCALKRDHFSREYIFQPLIFRGHVSFQGSNVLEVTLNPSRFNYSQARDLYLK